MNAPAFVIWWRRLWWPLADAIFRGMRDEYNAATRAPPQRVHCPRCRATHLLRGSIEGDGLVNYTTTCAGSELSISLDDEDVAASSTLDGGFSRHVERRFAECVVMAVKP